ncbi:MULTISPECIES: DUF7379 domain-containing protein [Aurantimonas]|uniref:DUF7379 domain-containing protein n=1 Tax=Aurantimonas TaxID=182269 RepID=UPI0004008B46|nr:CHAT domain-containing protein [Aurantimonas coralicida]
MVETVINENTRVIHASDVTVVSKAFEGPGGMRRGRRSAFDIEAQADPEATDALLDALEGDDAVTIADDFDIVPVEAPDAPSGRPRRSTAPEPKDTKVEIEVGDDESAALLLESDGVYAWKLPREVPVRRRGGEAPGKTLVFTIDVASAEDGGEMRSRRGLGDWFAGKITDPIRAIVVKFAARRTIGVAERSLERNVRPGLIVIRDYNINDWRVGDRPPQVSLPVGEPARILLMIHGTFSSTVGSFGALSATEGGRAFLGSAFVHYDAVIAFDHRTLSESPQENAAAIMEALAGLSIAPESTVDMIGFSRGGLVTRVLVEKMLRKVGSPLTPRNAVFVGCTNGGTALANPENWKALLDIFTNLSVAAGKGLSYLGAGTSGTIISESLKTLSGFVQAIVDTAITEEMVPGIAAMAPSSQLVSELNDPGRAADTAEISYFALGSNFEPRLFNSDQRTALSKRLLGALADFGVDTLMQQKNDLVVDIAAMTKFGVDTSRLKDKLFWDRNAIIYHTNYFAQNDVGELLSKWLIERNAGEIAEAEKPTIVIDAGMRAQEALGRMEIAGIDLSQTVVVSRLHYGDYVFRAGDIIEKLRRADAGMDLIEALDLHEGQVASRRRRSENKPLEFPPTGEIVTDDESDNIIAVTPSLMPPPSEANEFPATSAQASTAPPLEEAEVYGGVEFAARARMNRWTSGPSRYGRRSLRTPASETFAETETEQAECNFAAEMDRTVPLEKPAELTVTISREEIVIAEGKAGAQAKKTVATADPINIVVQPITNCSMVGDGRTEIVVPKPGEPEVYVFEVKGKQAGPAEIWVDAMQGRRRLARFVLQPEFVASGKITAAAAVDTAQEDPPLVRLRILDSSDGDGGRDLTYLIESEDLEFRDQASQTISSQQRTAYLDGLFQKLEGAWGSGINYNHFFDDLTDNGSYLYNAIVPEKIRRLVWEHRDKIGSIEVVSEEPFIPWELLYVSDPQDRGIGAGTRFLAEMGLVRWVASSFPPANLRVRSGHACHIVPDYSSPAGRLEGAELERTMMASLFASRSIAANRSSILAEMKAESDVDLYHFACHGSAGQDNIWNAGLLLSASTDPETREKIESRLTVQNIEARADLFRPAGARPIVFLNACQAGNTGATFSGSGGMAKAFIEKGAGLFVGALWSVGDQTALSFARTFYESLASGRTVAAATREARRKAKADAEPTWLAYTVYGHPYARLSP